MMRTLPTLIVVACLAAMAGCSDDASDDPGPSTGGQGASGGGGPATGTGAGATTSGAGGSGGDGGAPADFWDASGIPPATNVLVFKFLNRTNGLFGDDEVYWRFDHDDIHELHSIAEQPIYDMPANASGRMYFYICARTDAACAADPTESKYFDFIEHTIGDDQYNGNTTRVDAFGLKIAMLLHASDGFEEAVGEVTPDGDLAKDALWDDPTTFYQAAPANYYARFWHERGIDGKAYGFPYDDVGSYSTYVSHGDPQYLLVAIGW
jgi:hypothetical protein